MTTPNEEFFSGPASDNPLTLGLATEGEVVLSGYVAAQAWHEDGGERQLYFGVYEDSEMVTQGIVDCKFVNGVLQDKIHFGVIRLPAYDAYHHYHLVWRLEDPAGGPAYTGMPQFNCRLRARNL